MYSFPDESLIPGLIDIHLHGYGGYGGYGLARGEGIVSQETIATEALSNLLPRHGVTAFLPTISAHHEKIGSIIEAITKVGDLDSCRPGGARVLGINLEGPFLNPSWAGALSSGNFCRPSKYLLQKWHQQSLGKLAMITLAPELQGSNQIIKLSEELGIIAAMGHSNASYEVVEDCLRSGLRHVTHAFNAMKGFHHREPATVGALLTFPQLTAELIADGLHVHSAAIRLLLLAKGWEKMILVSDAIPWGGLSDGRYHLYESEQEIFVGNGTCTLSNGRLAGSFFPLNKGVMTMTKSLNIPFYQIVAMASLNPAGLLRLDNQFGSLEIGKKADFVVIDEDFKVHLTVIDGSIVYDSKRDHEDWPSGSI